MLNPQTRIPVKWGSLITSTHTVENMDTLTTLLTNPNWQAFVFSPLVGVLLSIFLSPPGSGTKSTFAVNSHNNYFSHNHINSNESPENPGLTQNDIMAAALVFSAAR